MAGVQILRRCYQLLCGVCTAAHAPALPRSVYTRSGRMDSSFVFLNERLLSATSGDSLR